MKRVYLWLDYDPGQLSGDDRIAVKRTVIAAGGWLVEGETSWMPKLLHTRINRPGRGEILLYHRFVVESAGICIPSPRLTDDAALAKEMAEFAPELRHPVYRKTIRELAARGARQARPSPSEVQAQHELQHARGAEASGSVIGRRADDAEVSGSRDVVRRGSKLRPVEQVERLGPKLEID